MSQVLSKMTHSRPLRLNRYVEIPPADLQQHYNRNRRRLGPHRAPAECHDAPLCGTSLLESHYLSNRPPNHKSQQPLREAQTASERLRERFTVTL